MPCLPMARDVGQSGPNVPGAAAVPLPSSLKSYERANGLYWTGRSFVRTVTSSHSMLNRASGSMRHEVPPQSGDETPPANGIGQPVRRKEDARLVVGAGRYSDDLSFPGQLHAVMARSWPIPTWHCR